QIAARDVYNVLRKYEKAFRFHALIRQATGVALAPVVWCDTIFIRPGGIIGGLNLVIDEARYPGMEAGVVLMNLALNAGEEAARHGRSAELVRAMIDPGQAVNGWRDSAGRVQISPWVPNDIHSADFIVQHPAGTVLTLTERQAAELRFARPYDGDVAALGRELGFPHWIAQGDAGRVAMTEAMKAEQFKAGAAADDRRQFLIDLNRRRRTAAKGSIERFLNLANEWNPKLGTYSTYKQTSRWWDSYWDGCGYDTGRLTPESRRKWRDRSDVTVAALSKARGGVLEMKYLEKEARELGQDLLYPEGRLEEMRLDLELKIALLIRERDKRFKDD
ncbi:MAG: hypothetical protein HY293_02535, partial [Planctomycetes bacterium]|nr:hypothetical protein [Planctomycetota bacterium]